MADLPHEVEVLVVGGGPTGLFAANLLALYGIDVLLIERNPTTVQEPRAVILDDEASRLLATLGAEAAMAPHGFGPVGVYYYSTMGFTILRVEGFTTPNGFPNRTTIWQPKLEEILADTLRSRAPGRLVHDTRLAGFTQDGSGVSCELETPTGPHRLRAQYLLAADGARSLVRAALPVSFGGTTADEQPHVVVDVADDPDGHLPHTKFYCDPRRPCTCVPLPYGMRRFEFFLFPHEDPQAMLEPENLARLFAPYRDWAKVTVVRKAVYVFHARLASALGHRRVFLAGDAAHLMPPFGAQGLNSGARDANSLAWKLAGVLRGTLPVTALDAYDPERRAHLAAIIRYSVGMGRLSNVTSRVLALLRDLALGAALLIPPVRRYFQQMRHMPRPDVRAGLVAGSAHRAEGRPVPRLRLRDAQGAEHWLDDLAGPGFALLRFGAEVPPAVLARLRERWPDLPVLDIGGALRPVDPAAVAGLAATLVLMRPDRYSAIVAPAEGFAQALTCLERRLDDCREPPCSPVLLPRKTGA